MTPDSTRLNRKRPHINNGRTYKDHSKNVLFKATLQEHLKHLANCGIALNQHQAIALRLRYIAEHVIRSLNEFGWAVVDNFLGKTHTQYVHRKELNKICIIPTLGTLSKAQRTPCIPPSLYTSSSL
uniref:Uncharacterized protein n=1 Tax=Acrobeloides nanus TaxID=290746 RepID=A0A914DF77_9BILA